MLCYYFFKMILFVLPTLQHCKILGNKNIFEESRIYVVPIHLSSSLVATNPIELNVSVIAIALQVA